MAFLSVSIVDSCLIIQQHYQNLTAQDDGMLTLWNPLVEAIRYVYFALILNQQTQNSASVTINLCIPMWE